MQICQTLVSTYVVNVEWIKRSFIDQIFVDMKTFDILEKFMILTIFLEDFSDWILGQHMQKPKI